MKDFNENNMEYYIKLGDEKFITKSTKRKDTLIEMLDEYKWISLSSFSKGNISLGILLQEIENQGKTDKINDIYTLSNLPSDEELYDRFNEKGTNLHFAYALGKCNNVDEQAQKFITDKYIVNIEEWKNVTNTTVTMKYDDVGNKTRDIHYMKFENKNNKKCGYVCVYELDCSDLKYSDQGHQEVDLSYKYLRQTKWSEYDGIID